MIKYINIPLNLPNDEVTIETQGKGIIVKDRTLGTLKRIYSDNGVISIENA